MQNLPEVTQGEDFWFACHPDVACFNACCSDLTMPLTPYDALRLQTALGLDSDSFFEDFTTMDCAADTGFPSLHLRMADSIGKPCPFLNSKGCSVYQHRSSACRTYPLGRATQVTDPEKPAASSIAEKFFLVREDHCLGFAEQLRWQTDTWLKDQGLEPYIYHNDKYARLIAIYKHFAKGAKLSGKHATMALLALYQMDRFAEFIQGVQIFTRLKLQGEWGKYSTEEFRHLVLKDSEMRLLFGYEWLRLVLFGQAENIAPA